MSPNMLALEMLFWIALLVVVYAYAGYGVIIYCLVRLKRAVRPAAPQAPLSTVVPHVALVVPAFNEADYIGAKISNCRALDYPPDKLKILVVADGCTDGTPEIARRFARVPLQNPPSHRKLMRAGGPRLPTSPRSSEPPGPARVEVLHRPERLGKAAAINRAMDHVTSPIVILSDANTLLNREAVREIVRHYGDPTIGAVAGEKRVRRRGSAAATGEGLYWRYESWLKRLDSELWTVVGAAGELLSYRRELFESLEEDSILDDFMLSLRIGARGYRVVYEPRAYAVEEASASIGEELKRRIRVAAGGWQSMLRLRSLLNPLPHATLTFQYLSHRVLRWSVVPLLLLLLLPVNAALAAGAGPHARLYEALLWAQLAVYGLALAGYLCDRRGYRVTGLYVPYYFVVANYAVLRGFGRFLAGRQPATWERARRAVMVVIALACSSTANGQERDASPHGQLSLDAVHFDNFFQAADGQPKQALWGQRLKGRLLVPLSPHAGILVYAEADAIRLPGFTPALGAGLGLRRNRKAGAFDAKLSYLWNRPTVEVSDDFGRADMLRFEGEYSHRPVDAVQIIGSGQYRHERYHSETHQSGVIFEIGPTVRYRGLGYAFAPEVGVRLGRRSGRGYNEAYWDRVLLLGASSLWGSRVYLSGRYRRRWRDYSLGDPRQSNFGREDRRHQFAVTVAVALRRELSWIAYYARERGSSTEPSRNFTTGFLSVGLTARF